MSVEISKKRLLLEERSLSGFISCCSANVDWMLEQSNIYIKRIIQERDKGKAILLVSFELDEILDLSDRIAVLFEGQITTTLNAKDTNEKKNLDCI